MEKDVFQEIQVIDEAGNTTTTREVTASRSASGGAFLARPKSYDNDGSDVEVTNWKVGDRVQIWSRSQDQWVSGEVKGVGNKILVSYGNREKNVQPNSQWIQRIDHNANIEALYRLFHQNTGRSIKYLFEDELATLLSHETDAKFFHALGYGPEDANILMRAIDNDDNGKLSYSEWQGFVGKPIKKDQFLGNLTKPKASQLLSHGETIYTGNSSNGFQSSKQISFKLDQQPYTTASSTQTTFHSSGGRISNEPILPPINSNSVGQSGDVISIDTYGNGVTKVIEVEEERTFSGDVITGVAESGIEIIREEVNDDEFVWEGDGNDDWFGSDNFVDNRGATLPPIIQGGQLNIQEHEYDIEQEVEIGVVAGASKTGVEIERIEHETEGIMISNVEFELERKDSFDLFMEDAILKQRVMEKSGRVISVYETDQEGQLIRIVQELNGDVTKLLLEDGKIIKMSSQPYAGIIQSQELTLQEREWIESAPAYLMVYGDAIMRGPYHQVYQNNVGQTDRKANVDIKNHRVWYQKYHCTHCIYWSGDCWVLAKSINDPPFARLLADIPYPGFDPKIPWYMEIDEMDVNEDIKRLPRSKTAIDKPEIDQDNMILLNVRSNIAYSDDEDVEEDRYQNIFPLLTVYRAKVNKRVAGDEAKIVPIRLRKALFVVSAKEAEKIQNVFNTFDFDNNRLLDYNEFHEFVEKYDSDMSENEIEAIFEYCDIEGIDMLDLYQLQSAMMACYQENNGAMKHKEALNKLKDKALLSEGSRTKKKRIVVGNSDEIEVHEDKTYEQKSHAYSIEISRGMPVMAIKRICLQKGYTSFLTKGDVAYFYDEDQKQILEDMEYQKGTTLYIMPKFNHWKVHKNEDSCDGTYVDMIDFDGSETALRKCKFICSARHYGGFTVFRGKAYLKASPCDKLLRRKTEFTGSTLYVAPPATPWVTFIEDETKDMPIFERDIERLYSEKIVRVNDRESLFLTLSGHQYGSISRSNLKDGTNKLGIGISRRMATPLFEQLDKNKDNLCDRNEFNAYVPSTVNDETYLKIMCDMLDKPVPEHAILKTKLYTGNTEFDHNIISLFKRLDVDSSGCISEAEYKNFVRIMDNKRMKHHEWHNLQQELRFDHDCIEIGHFAAIYGHHHRNLDDDLQRMRDVEDGFRILDERYKPYIKDKELGTIEITEEQAKLMEEERKKLGNGKYCFPTPCCWCWILFLILLCNIITWLFGNLFDETSEYTYSLDVLDAYNAANVAGGACATDTSLLDDKWRIQYDSQTHYILNESYNSDSYEVNFGSDKSEEERWVIAVVIALSLCLFLFSTIWICIENLIYDMTCRWPKLDHFGSTPEAYADSCRKAGKIPDLGIYDMIYRPYFYLRVQELYYGKHDKNVQTKI